jgi:hypothetical protein
MGLFEIISQGCQSLAAATAPSVSAMGIHIVIALATMMLVWFGVQEALASSQGGPGFSMGKFLNLFMLLTFAYAMVNYYDSSIPGLGFSIKGFIDGGTANLVNIIGADGSTTMLKEIHAASSKTGPSIVSSLMSPYYAIVYFAVQLLLASWQRWSLRSWPTVLSPQRSSVCLGRSSFRFLSLTSSIGSFGVGSSLI